MSRKSITLFMWGYQPHYRYEVKRRMNNVMAELGIEGAGADCLDVELKISPALTSTWPPEDRSQMDTYTEAPA